MSLLLVELEELRAPKLEAIQGPLGWHGCPWRGTMKASTTTKQSVSDQNTTTITKDSID
jgi:hypothetical protein